MPKNHSLQAVSPCLLCLGEVFEMETLTRLLWSESNQEKEKNMALPQDVMTKENYERWERGLPLIKEKRIPREEPKLPSVANEIKLAEISTDEVIDFRSRKHNLRNEEGINFVGYDVEIFLRGVNQPMCGWMIEGDYHALKRSIRDILKQENLREW